MKRIGFFSAMVAAALVAFAPLAAMAQVSTPNFQNQAGWHVGGVLEVIPGGTLRLDTGTKTAAATAGAATLSKLSGVVTSEALVTAAGATYTLTLTNTRIAAGDIVLWSVGNGTQSAGLPAPANVQVGAGSAVFVVRNAHASAAFNGTITVSYAVLKQ